MPVMKHLNVGGTTYDTVGEASVTQVLSSGTKIATVSIDGTATDLYAPAGGSSVDPATAAPSMDGTAAVGSSAKYAREDHVHPSDTSRLSGVILNTSSEPYNVPVANSSATIYVGDGLNVSDSNDRITLKAKTGTTSGTVAAGNHTHSGYQATLVSGTNIKTINGDSLLGSGDLDVGGDVSMTEEEVDAAVYAAWPSYAITNNASAYATVGKTSATEGETVSVTVTSVDAPHTVKAYFGTSNRTLGSWNSVGTHTFVMPSADVTIAYEFAGGGND